MMRTVPSYHMPISSSRLLPSPIFFAEPPPILARASALIRRPRRGPMLHTIIAICLPDILALRERIFSRGFISLAVLLQPDLTPRKDLPMKLFEVRTLGPIVMALLLLCVFSTAFAATAFGPPLQVTPYPGKGYEPAVYVDQLGNIFATAHKENWQLVLGPDPNSPTYTRSMSWDWVSTDGGLTFHDLPGLTPLSLEQHEFGDER